MMKMTLAALLTTFALAGTAAAHGGDKTAYIADFNLAYLLGTSAAQARNVERGTSSTVIVGNSSQDEAYVAPFNRSYLLGTRLAQRSGEERVAATRGPTEAIERARTASADRAPTVTP